LSVCRVKLRGLATSLTNRDAPVMGLPFCLHERILPSMTIFQPSFIALSIPDSSCNAQNFYHMKLAVLKFSDSCPYL
uniref:Ovule protein n=1 Tax=Mesocestoides corti TaxID=53468 RepID=A0A5K3FU45_MESCO